MPGTDRFYLNNDLQFRFNRALFPTGPKAI